MWVYLYTHMQTHTSYTHNTHIAKHTHTHIHAPTNKQHKHNIHIDKHTQRQHIHTTHTHVDKHTNIYITIQYITNFQYNTPAKISSSQRITISVIILFLNILLKYTHT